MENSANLRPEAARFSPQPPAQGQLEISFIAESFTQNHLKSGKSNLSHETFKLNVYFNMDSETSSLENGDLPIRAR